MAKKNNNKEEIYQVCSDIKSNTTEESANLPSSYKIIPIIFYAVLGLYFISLILNTILYNFFLKDNEESYQEIITTLNSQKSVYDKDLKNLKEKMSNATIMGKWLEKGNMFQPLVIALSKGLEKVKDIKINSIQFSISEDSLPGQVSFDLMFFTPVNNNFDEQVILTDYIFPELEKLNYKQIDFGTFKRETKDLNSIHLTSTIEKY